MISLPITSSLMVCGMAIGFVYPKLYTNIKALSEGKKTKYLVPLFLTSVGINVTLFIFHILSIINFMQYGNEILYSTELNFSDNHSSITIFHAIFSLLVIAIVFTLATVWSILRIIGHYWKTSVAMTIALNFVYIGCYYLPYIILAFIHDPFQSCFIYLVEMVFCGCGYLFCYGLGCFHSYFNSSEGIFNTLLVKTVLIWTTAATTIYYLLAIIYILTLGNFHDFRDVQNLLLPLLIAVFSVFLGKPAYDVYTKSTNTEEDKKQLAESEDKETEMN